MKRMTYDAGSIVTSDAIAAALIDYIPSAHDVSQSLVVDVTVLEENNETSTHTLILSPATQFDIEDAEGLAGDEDAGRFPLPQLPTTTITGHVETTDDARQAADDFNLVTDEIDNGLGQ